MRKTIFALLLLSCALTLTACSTDVNPQSTTMYSTKSTVTATTVPLTTVTGVTETSTVPPETTTVATTTTTSVVPTTVMLTADGSEVTVRSLTIENYTVGEFAAHVNDADLSENAPTMEVDARYFVERDWLRYRFTDGRTALAERYFLFSDGALIAEGNSGVSPSESGEYLLMIDFLFCENAVVSAERVAVKLNCTRGERYEAELARGYPNDPHQLIFTSDASADIIAERLSGKRVFAADTDDPAEALRQYFTAQLATRQQTADVETAIDEFRILDVRTDAVHLLESYRSYAVYFRYAVKPASEQFVYSQTLTPVWGEGDLAGWAIYDGMVYLKHCGDRWLWLESAMPGESASLPFGFVWCGGDSLAPKFEPSLFVIPENWRSATLDGDHTALRELLVMDWEALEVAYGSNGVDYFMARLRANAFSNLTNRNVTHNSDIFTNPRDLPQTLRTLIILRSAANIPDAVRDNYAALVRDLQAIVPTAFSEAWEMLSDSERDFARILTE